MHPLFRPVVPFMLLLASALLHAGGPSVTVDKINDHLYKLTTAGPGGSAACVASVGADGILLVDTGVETAAPDLKKALEGLGGTIAAIILTHEHADHTGGLALLGAGVPVYAHPKVKEELTTGYNVLRELPAGVLPNKPVDGPLTLRFNGEEVRIIPVPGGHSDTDMVVLFAGSKVACLGGFCNPERFPYVDFNKGGSIAAYDPLTARLLKELPADTLLVPGHGGNSDMAALKRFQAMLSQSYHAVQVADMAGKDLKSLDAKELFKGLEPFGQGFVTPDLWLKFFVTEGRPEQKAQALEQKMLIEPLHQALKKGGSDAVVARYRELKASAPEAYDFNEGVLNALGYHLLLSRNDTAGAIAVFKLNVEEYPQAYNPYDSLGEAYMLAGQRDLAIKSYETALKINPDFENSRKMLEKLKENKASKP
jgi:glyoxylase-like metal-dependent hydrolase (beta-lactamase superfamily II)